MSSQRMLATIALVFVSAGCYRQEAEPIHQSAAPGLYARTESVASLLPFVGAAARFGLTRRLRVVLGADLGAALPEAGVRFVGRDVARWGLPVVMSTAALELVGP